MSNPLIAFLPCSFLHNMPAIHISWNSFTAGSLLKGKKQYLAITLKYEVRCCNNLIELVFILIVSTILKLHTLKKYQKECKSLLYL